MKNVTLSCVIAQSEKYSNKFGRNEKQYELDNLKKGLTENDIDLISTLQPDLFHDICDDLEMEN